MTLHPLVTLLLIMISLTQIQATPPSPPNEPIVACKGRNLGTRANLAVNIVEGATTCAEVERIGSGDVVKVAFKAMRCVRSAFRVGHFYTPVAALL